MFGHAILYMSHFFQADMDCDDIEFNIVDEDADEKDENTASSDPDYTARWKKRDPARTSAEFTGYAFSLHVFEKDISPLDYFKWFF